MPRVLSKHKLLQSNTFRFRKPLTWKIVLLVWIEDVIYCLFKTGLPESVILMLFIVNICLFSLSIPKCLELRIQPLLNKYIFKLKRCESLYLKIHINKQLGQWFNLWIGRWMNKKSLTILFKSALKHWIWFWLFLKNTVMYTKRNSWKISRRSML